ncbi:MAG: GYDIA family GHMP kinase [Flavobacteriales bacterium AspAUS03]
MRPQHFYSHGKLLLTGEYFILDGAWGLALPTRKGQSLRVSPLEAHTELHWKSLDETSQIWFEAFFELPSLRIHHHTEKKVALLLKKLLQAAQRLQIDFLQKPVGISVETQLEFPRDWGLGSSSTLIYNIAQWARVDPYTLLWSSLPGSGYDIACAIHHLPILYRLKNQKPQVAPIEFTPLFKGRLYFLHLNRKQNSRKSIQTYRTKDVPNENFKLISSITQKLPYCTTLDNFEKLLSDHEQILSNLLGTPTLKEQYFPDYPGMIKSLGAWGGDFALVGAREGMRDYFSHKGFHTMVPFDQMML